MKPLPLVISPVFAMIQAMMFLAGIVVDQNQALRFALDVARGMEFLHSLEPMIPNMYLNSKHVMVSSCLLYFSLLQSW